MRFFKLPSGQMQQMRNEDAERGDGDPANVRIPDIQASAMMPVMMVPDANTMPI